MMGGLAGKRVVNTRAPHQAGELDTLLRSRGAIPVSFPCIKIELIADSTRLDRAITDLCAGAFDWLTLTSANAVLAVAQRLRALGLTIPVPPPFATGVVGPGTAESVIRELGLSAETIPDSFSGADLGRTLPVGEGHRVLVPQSEIASPGLATTLIARGAVVNTVTAYRTVTGNGGVDLPALLARGEIDAVVFASPSAVDGCAARVGDDFRLLNSVPVICIGPSTAESALRQGLKTPIAPAQHTLAGLMHALEHEFAVLSKGIAS
jgi:uroporphyrinogen-III synthase